ncbi:hypothetical protein [Streptomyces atriruber]|uniref:hypothetical protein n=1 Tax=Streptomyces atriruber TaxID=545121 RepID=UPI0006E30C94|nr:hypothetical protein [Streptomyces atriruber]
MRIRQAGLLSAAALSVAALTLVSGCGGGGGSDAPASSKPKPSASASSEPSGRTRPWEPDDAQRRADRALDAAAEDDGTEAEFVDSGTAYVGSGLDKSFPAADGDPYRFEITCDTDEAEELTLTLSRGKEEQAYGVGCGDREADQFNIPAGKPFKARVAPEKDGTGLISWRLNKVDPADVAGCDDDIDGCED